MCLCILDFPVHISHRPVLSETVIFKKIKIGGRDVRRSCVSGDQLNTCRKCTKVIFSDSLGETFGRVVL